MTLYYQKSSSPFNSKLTERISWKICKLTIIGFVFSLAPELLPSTGHHQVINHPTFRPNDPIRQVRFVTPSDKDLESLTSKPYYNCGRENSSVKLPLQLSMVAGNTVGVNAKVIYLLFYLIAVRII